jgi:hypothetical protein
MEDYDDKPANHVFAVGLVLLGLVYLTYVFLWFDFSAFMSMTLFYILGSSALMVVGYLLYTWDEMLISFLFVGVGLLELANGLSGWFGYTRWEGAFLVLAVIIVVMAILVLMQNGYILGMAMMAAAVAYLLEIILTVQAGEVLGTIIGAVYLIATILFLYLGVAIMVNDEMDEDILPIV